MNYCNTLTEVVGFSGFLGFNGVQCSRCQLGIAEVEPAKALFPVAV